MLLAGGLQQVRTAEYLMYKPRWDAFYDTKLDLHLRESCTNTLVFAGYNFPNCPRTSIYEASNATSGVYW